LFREYLYKQISKRAIQQLETMFKINQQSSQKESTLLVFRENRRLKQKIAELETSLASASTQISHLKEENDNLSSGLKKGEGMKRKFAALKN